MEVGLNEARQNGPMAGVDGAVDFFNFTCKRGFACFFDFCDTIVSHEQVAAKNQAVGVHGYQKSVFK
jgi:hypothetical protein